MSTDTASVFAEACSLHKQGDLLGAERAYRQCLAEQPDLQTYLQLGVALYDLDRFADAHDVYLEAIERLPDAEPLWFRAGDCALRADDLDEAERCFRTGLTPQGEAHLCQLGLARVAMLRQDFDQAQAAAKAALEARPWELSVFEADDDLIPAVDRLHTELWQSRQINDSVLASYRAAYAHPRKLVVKHLFRQLATEAHGNLRLLDFGCASAALAGCLSELNLLGQIHYVGCDIHPELLAAAREAHPDCEIHDTTDMNDLDALFASGFDLIHFGAVLCTINPTQAKDLLDRALPHCHQIMICDPLVAFDKTTSMVINRGQNVLPLYAHPLRLWLEAHGFHVTEPFFETEDALLQDQSGIVLAKRG